MLKPEVDDLLMPSSILGYSSEHFQLKCLQFHPDAAGTNYVEILTRALLCQQTCYMDFRAAVIDNIGNSPSSTTANDSFHGTSVSLENENSARIQEIYSPVTLNVHRNFKYSLSSG